MMQPSADDQKLAAELAKKAQTAARQKPAAPPEEPAAEWVPLDSLKPWAANPKPHEDVSHIVASIQEFGFGEVITARLANREILSGHGRVKAARALKMTHVPVRFLDLSERKAHLYALAANRLTEISPYDERALLELLQQYEVAEVALAGWSSDDLKVMADSLLEGAGGDTGGSGEVVEDEVPEPPKVPVTQPGDVWQLGRHRLVCGDATSRSSWVPLGKVDGVFTSPPYALGKNAGRLRTSNGEGRAESAYDEHQDTPEGWPELMRGFTALAFAATSCVIVNVQALSGNKRPLFAWVAENAERLCDVIVWNKGTAQPAIDAGVLDSMFEFLWIFGEPNATRRVPHASFRGTVRNVYEAPAARAADKVTSEHGAVFPMHLPTFVMRDLCSRAQTWLDPFAGTGTSISCAEQLERTCHGIELSPAYCDVVVERWQALSGGKAQRVSG